MKNRTTLRQIIRLAWLLFRYRRYLRIGQMLSNASGASDVFHMENGPLLKRLRDL